MRWIVGLVATLCVAGSGLTRGADRPNVVLIVTDDQGYGDFGATGNPVLETPRIDALARDGMTMGTFYVSPVCSPTRACLMTGRYNYRTRCIDTWVGRSMMDPQEVTLAEALRQAGYTTGIFGKWHLGDCYPMRSIDQGFDQSLVLRGGGLAQPSDPPENRRRYTDPILFRQGEPVQTSGYCTDVYFKAAIDFISQSHQRQQPFFVYVATNAPHGPLHDVPPELLDHYRGLADGLAQLPITNRPGPVSDQEIDRMARIAAMITNIDQNVGRLLDALRQQQIDRNTLVLFMVDNGPDTRRYVGPFRGMKGDVYEGGIRSPLWLYWPGRINAGSESQVPIAHIDIMPTLLEACGVDPPPVEFDGRSFWPLVTGQRDDLPERSIVIQSHRGDQPVLYHQFMIRRGKWKLLHNSGFGRESFSGPPQWELYDILNDPQEANNLAASHGDIVEQLRAEYERWFQDVSTTRPDNFAPPRIVVGTPFENPTVLTRQDCRSGNWEPESVGVWKLEFAADRVCDVRLLLRPAASGDQMLRLVIGDRVLEQPVDQGSEWVEFPGLELNAGPVDLLAELVQGDQRRAVHQVEIHWRENPGATEEVLPDAR